MAVPSTLSKPKESATVAVPPIEAPVPTAAEKTEAATSATLAASTPEINKPTAEAHSATSTPTANVLRKRKSRLNISLDADEAAQALDGIEEESEDEGSSPFEMEVLLELWSEVAEHFRAQNPSVASLLKGMTPERSEQGNLLLKVGSNTSLKVISLLKKELIEHLKMRLNLEKLRIEITVEATQKDKRPYFPEEIYLHFLQANPAIEDFVKKFDLDFR